MVADSQIAALRMRWVARQERHHILHPANKNARHGPPPLNNAESLAKSGRKLILERRISFLSSSDLTWQSSERMIIEGGGGRGDQIMRAWWINVSLRRPSRWRNKQETRVVAGRLEWLNFNINCLYLYLGVQTRYCWLVLLEEEEAKKMITLWKLLDLCDCINKIFLEDTSCSFNPVRHRQCDSYWTGIFLEIPAINCAKIVQEEEHYYSLWTCSESVISLPAARSSARLHHTNSQSSSSSNVNRKIFAWP